MAKYLILWELDASRIPEDPKERGAAWTMIADMIKEDLKAGFDVDWGAFISEGKGYTISDGNDMEISQGCSGSCLSSISRYTPL